MDRSGADGAGGNIEPPVDKLFEVHYENQVRLITLADLHARTYTALEAKIRSDFTGWIFRDDWVSLYLTRDLRNESLIRNDMDVGIVINLPEEICSIYVTVLMPMHALRDRVVKLDTRILNAEHTLTDILFFLREDQPYLEVGQVGPGWHEDMGHGGRPMRAVECLLVEINSGPN